MHARLHNKEVWLLAENSEALQNFRTEATPLYYVTSHATMKLVLSLVC